MAGQLQLIALSSNSEETEAMMAWQQKYAEKFAPPAIALTPQFGGIVAAAKALSVADVDGLLIFDERVPELAELMTIVNAAGMRLFSVKQGKDALNAEVEDIPYLSSTDRLLQRIRELEARVNMLVHAQTSGTQVIRANELRIVDDSGATIIHLHKVGSSGRIDILNEAGQVVCILQTDQAGNGRLKLGAARGGFKTITHQDIFWQTTEQ